LKAWYSWRLVTRISGIVDVTLETFVSASIWNTRWLIWKESRKIRDGLLFTGKKVPGKVDCKTFKTSQNIENKDASRKTGSLD